MEIPAIVVRVQGLNASSATQKLLDFKAHNPGYDIHICDDFDQAAEFAAVKAKKSDVNYAHGG
jgi:hypothetical protein